MTPILEMQNVSVAFPTSRGAVTAVEDLSLALGARETLAIVGESGSGKSTAALEILGLIPESASRRASGKVMFDGMDLRALSPRELRKIRGHRIGMIFQDPMMALNPVFTIGRQIAEPLREHFGLSARAARKRVIELLDRVGIPAPEQRVDQYPHNLSGGMRQRVMIATALACQPNVLIADEPTTALDVTVQAQVLELINDLKAEFGMAVLLITHDLGVVWETAQRAVVMYAGRKVEEGAIEEIFRRPAHPYTRGLLEAAKWEERQDGLLREIRGTVPSAHELPPGCRFAPRCDFAIERCKAGVPPLVNVAAEHEAACVRLHELVP
jgi:peptide/nickel transport system ATP-binding protein